MAKKGKQKHGPSPIPKSSSVSTSIPQPKPVEEYITFCFRDFDVTSKKFCPGKAPAGFLKQVLERLRNVSSMRITDFVAPHKAMRSHGIEFSGTSEKSGFAHLNHSQWKAKPWQFSVSTSNGRFIGYLVDSCFHVVWFDYDHLLYPSKK